MHEEPAAPATRDWMLCRSKQVRKLLEKRLFLGHGHAREELGRRGDQPLDFALRAVDLG